MYEGKLPISKPECEALTRHILFRPATLLPQLRFASAGRKSLRVIGLLHKRKTTYATHTD